MEGCRSGNATAVMMDSSSPATSNSVFRKPVISVEEERDVITMATVQGVQTKTVTLALTSGPFATDARTITSLIQMVSVFLF